MKKAKIKQRLSQRKKIARSIKGLRLIPTCRNKIDGIDYLKLIASNYPKIKGEVL